MEDKEELEYIIQSENRFSLRLKELWSYRELFYFFTWRDVKVKYKQTVLGILWVVLQPVLTVLIFSVFFGRALRVPSSGLPYPVFVFSGLLLWNFFSSSVNAAGNSMMTNSVIIKKIYFPRIIIPVSAVLVSGLDFIIGFVTFLAFLLYYEVTINFTQLVVMWPLALLILFSGTLGISCYLAALIVKYRDFRYITTFGLQVALFLSPVIYPTSIVNQPWLNYLLALNPMYAAINIFRLPLIGYEHNLDLLVLSSVSTFVFLALGLYYFKKTEAFFADIA